MVSAEEIKKLREITGCGIIDCKKALEEAKGDFGKAQDNLRQRGLELAAKKGGRVAKEGRLESYVHPGNKLVAVVEVNCETDFVAKSEEFTTFAKDVALHIAASSPRYIKREEIPAEVLQAQSDVETFIKENCLLNQPFVKDQKLTIQDYLNNLVAKIGENIFIGRFIRYKVGEVE